MAGSPEISQAELSAYYEEHGKPDESGEILAYTMIMRDAIMLKLFREKTLEKRRKK